MSEINLSAHVLMYTTAVCPYCVRAEQLLRARGVAEIEKVRIDLHAERRAEMMEKSGRRTVPQIFIGNTHVGGCDDLIALDQAGRLAPLLAGSV
jgi:glutaredoxin 3